MKNIRLKPLYLPNDDILVQPPSFLFPIEQSTKEGSKIILNNLDDLKTILRGRQLKSLTARKKHLLTEEQDGVAKLSDFKVPVRTVKSPLARRYTFRRTLSNVSDGGSKNLLIHSPKKTEEKPSFIITIQTIVTKEKTNSKETEAEMQKFTENNKIYEKILKTKIEGMEQEIESVAELISKYKSELEDVFNSKRKAEKTYEDTINEITIKEKNHMLSMHSVKGKKKHTLDVSEEREYFIIKESLRKTKRDLHAGHTEKMERTQAILEHYQHTLEEQQRHKRACQKELKDLTESLISFYCSNLKEGMDLREEGIRWTIKALWNIRQPVPISTFPRYLDDESAHFLLSMAEKDMEIASLQSRLSEMREEIKKDHQNSSFSKSPLELFNIVKGRIKEIKQKAKAMSIDSSEVQENLKSTCVDNSFSRYDEIKSIKTRLRCEEKERDDLTLEEVKRVVAGYQSDNAHGVVLAHIIKTLVGDKHREFRKFAHRKSLQKDN